MCEHNKQSVQQSQLNTHNIAYTVPMTLVVTDEYNNLIADNRSLKEQLSTLQHREKELLEQIDFHKRTVDELRKENDMLREEIKKLKEHVQRLEDDNKSIKNDNLLIKKQLNKLLKNEQFNRLCVAIQDVNEIYKINDHTDEFRDLRLDRNSMCHYIRTHDSENIKFQKTQRLLYELENMSDDVKFEFNYNYPAMVDKVTQYLNSKNIRSSNITTRDVSHFWA